jgi:hypothetical protein
MLKHIRQLARARARCRYWQRELHISRNERNTINREHMELPKWITDVHGPETNHRTLEASAKHKSSDTKH